MHAVARWCILPLVKTSIMPNHITHLRLLTGIGAAVAFGVGNYFCSAWGGAIFFISAMLDRADGELAARRTALRRVDIGMIWRAT